MIATEGLTDRQFRSIADIVQSQVGIQLPPGKRTMVEGRLRKRVRALGLDDVGSYVELLFEKNRLEEELVHLIDCVTTNKTDFFREPAHFDFLRAVAIPALTARAGARRARLKVWSAACSIGAEAYTTAMVLDDLARAGPPFDFSILGTDISTDVVKQARAAIYSLDMLEPVPSHLAQRYLMAAREAGRREARIVPELRRRVRFERINLMDESYPVDRDVDIIFCRNVLIYFHKTTQKEVIERLSAHLRPGGYLLLGHSESMAGGGRFALKQIMPTIFQK